MTVMTIQTLEGDSLHWYINPMILKKRSPINIDPIQKFKESW
jgi:hypothetical protein